MIGVDTNVLVRAVLEDDLVESKLAKRLLKKLSSEKKLLITPHAILEMVWVLKVKKKTRQDIAQAVLVLLEAEGVVISSRDIIAMAIEWYRDGKADFGDYLILADSKANGASGVASFDKIFCKDSNHVQHPKKYLH